MMQILREAFTQSNDKENRRKQPGQRAGSVPPRARTPSNGHSGGKGVVTPAVRSASTMLGSQSVPSNKRPRLGDSTATYSNAGGARVHTRPASPSRIVVPVTVAASKTPAPNSGLPRLVSASRTETQQYALGHGRVPSAQAGRGYAAPSRAASATSFRTRGSSGSSNTLSRSVGAGQAPQGITRKASRARRESFRPRPSMEGPWTGGGANGRYGGFAGALAVKEEDERCYG
jgi:Ase1/PRC1/MAP65 family protein